MRKSANTDDNGVPRSGNRSRDISSGNKNEPGSGILAMSGCGDFVLSIHGRGNIYLAINETYDLHETARLPKADGSQ